MRNSPRIALPQLEAVLLEQRRTQTELADLLGFRRQQVTECKRKGFFLGDADRIASWLGVPLDLLTARGVPAPAAPPSVATLLARPEMASIREETAAAMLATLDGALRDAVAAALGMMQRGVVPTVPNLPQLRAKVSASASTAGSAPRRQVTRGK